MSEVKNKKSKKEEGELLSTQGPTPEDKTEEKPLVIVSRKEWGAAPPNFPGLQPLKRPAMTVMLRYFTGRDVCHTAEECIPVMRDIQRRDQDNNLVDISHNFLVGPDGTVFEGRGWTVSESPDLDMLRIGKQLRQPQTVQQYIINLAYIGNWEGEEAVSDVMKNSLKAIINHGVDCQQIAEKHKVMSMHEIF
ncbi:peptidoglycan recognition protein 4-like [Macrosteles quadrilineatus]|uniref:peptidoglycan recognition protein 4-like n=1 Tax=Macrosteles quadrilineatus TaxID=74068 RepID=UPI0023E28B61|nr:peptidoglycan recognition protein 4-like [Macrosteles quadrilineatus]